MPFRRREARAAADRAAFADVRCVTEELKARWRAARCSSRATSSSGSLLGGSGSTLRNKHTQGIFIALQALQGCRKPFLADSLNDPVQL